MSIKEKLEIDRELRKIMRTLIEWYLTGELDDRIEMEKLNSEDIETMGATDYSQADGSQAGVITGGGCSVIDRLQSDKAISRYRMKKLENIKKRLNKAYNILCKNKERKKVLELYYKKDYTNEELAEHMQYSVYTIREKRRKSLDFLIKLLNLRKEDKEVII